MISLFDFYPWIYKYAQLNPKQFPRLGMLQFALDQMDDAIRVLCRLCHAHMFGVSSIITIQ